MTGFDLPGSESATLALHRAEQERDAIGVKLVEALRERNEALDDRDFYKQAEKGARQQVEDLAKLADLIRAELATARAEMACPDPAAHTITEGDAQ